MDRLTITQRIKIIKTYYKNGDSATAMYRALRANYGLRNRPTAQLAKEEICRDWSGHKYCEACAPCAIVTKSVAEGPNVSIPLRSQELGLSYGTLWRILHLDLHLHHKKSCSCNNRSQLAIHNVVDTWNGYLNNRR